MTATRPEACLGTTRAADQARRGMYLAIGLGLLAFALIEMIRFGGDTCFAFAFFILPDLALFYGAARDLEPGRLHPGPYASTTPSTASGFPSR